MTTFDDATTRTDPGPLFTDGGAFVDLEGWHRAIDDHRPDGPFLRFDDDVHGTLWATVDLEALLEVSRRAEEFASCLLYTSPSPRDQRGSRMPSSA